MLALLLLTSVAVDSAAGDRLSCDASHDEDSLLQNLHGARTRAKRQGARADGELSNAYSSWQCPSPRYPDDKYRSTEWLEQNNFSWPKEFYATMLKERRSGPRYEAPPNHQLYTITDKSAQFCQMDDLEARFESTRSAGGFGDEASAKLIDNATSTLDANQGPIFYTDISAFGGSASLTLRNSLCALTRIGLINRTVVYFGSIASDNDMLVQLKIAFPGAIMISDTDLIKVETEFNSVFNKWRWVPIMLLLERGFSIVHFDPDVHMIKDPRPIFELPHYRDADVIFAYEHCLDFNGGFNFLRPASASIAMLRAFLTVQVPQIWSLDEAGNNVSMAMSTGDQFAISCAAAYAVVNSDLKVKVLRYSDVLFHWTPIANFFQGQCYGERTEGNLTVAEMPFAMHTSGTGSESRSEKMKQLGLWELESDEAVLGVCSASADPASQCNAGLRIDKADLVDYLNSKS